MTSRCQSPGAVRGPNRISRPCVVKAIDSGSSIDVFICKTEPQARDAIAKVLHAHGQVLVEQFIDGPELTVGLLEEQPLAPIRIVPKREFFDYEAKYKATTPSTASTSACPPDVVEHVQELARRRTIAIGCRDLARIDIMIDEKNKPYLLEINTLPGFTPKSLLPEAAAHAGDRFRPAGRSPGQARRTNVAPITKSRRTRRSSRRPGNDASRPSDPLTLATCASREYCSGMLISSDKEAVRPEYARVSAWPKQKRPSRSP